MCIRDRFFGIMEFLSLSLEILDLKTNNYIYFLSINFYILTYFIITLDVATDVLQCSAA